MPPSPRPTNPFAELTHSWPLLIALGGIVVLIDPGGSLMTLALVGLAFLLRGASEISAAWALRAAGSR